MPTPLYNPFKPFTFNNQTCFLTGQSIHSQDEKIQVFPSWFITYCQLRDKSFKLLNDSFTTYEKLYVPCTPTVINNCVNPLEQQIQAAFIGGYQTVKQLPSQLLFQWIAKMMYGVIYNEIAIGLRQQATLGEPFTLSQSLVHKFSHLHLMLQSIVHPITFEDHLPWTIEVFPVENIAETFSYRDEINTLTFCLKMNDFGIIACLQDNGTNKHYHQHTLAAIADKTLQPIQFEELCGRFFYSNYLFNRLPEYLILPTHDTTYIEAMPLHGNSNKPLFDAWDNKTYAQVLENFWKAWDIQKFEILKDPEKPISFLMDDFGKMRSDLPVTLSR